MRYTKEQKANGSTSAMICFFLPEDIASQIAIEGGEENLHCTLAYLGEAKDIKDVNALVSALANFAAYCKSLEAKLDGVIRFCANDPNAFCLNVASSELPNLRQAFCDCVSGFVTVNQEYGFTPHVTLQYLPSESDNPFDTIKPIAVTFDAVYLELGDDRYRFPLGKIEEPPPNYHLSEGAIICDNCYFSQGSHCTLYDFDFDTGYVCDDWQPSSTLPIPVISSQMIDIKAGARHSQSDMATLKKIYSNADDIRKAAIDLGYVLEEIEEELEEMEDEQKAWMDKILKAGGVEDEILGIWYSEKVDKYLVSAGDWATKETMDAIRKVFGKKLKDIMDEGSPDKDSDYKPVKAVTSSDLPLAPRDRAWSQSQAEKRVFEWANGDWSKYAKAFMYYDTENKEVKASYKLQFADIIEGKLTAIPRAIFAIAGGRGVNAADIPDSDKAKVKAQVNKYYRKMAKEFDDDSLVSPFEKEQKSELNDGNALKALREDEESLVVGNYIVLWNGRDAEGYLTGRKNKDGSIGEYFTPETELESEFTKAVGRLAIDWEHRQDNDPEAPKKNDILGYVDWSSVKYDHKGAWVERILNRRNKYIKMIEPLIRERMIGNSSEAVPEDVQKANDGRIIKWPLMRDTLTVSPMEPRMLTENQLVALKALGLLPEQIRQKQIITRLRILKENY